MEIYQNFPPKDFTDSCQYYRLARMMEFSLEHLVVEKKSSETDFAYLKRYTQLKSLEITFKQGSAYITNCVKVIENTPKIDDLSLEFDDDKNTDSSAASTTTTADTIVMVDPSINMKTLRIRYFRPASNEDISFLTSKFTNVSDLSLWTKDHYWLEEESKILSKSIIKFFKFIKNIKKHILHMHLETDSRVWMEGFRLFYQLEQYRNSTIDFFQLKVTIK
jgi:hypothetical protein